MFAFLAKARIPVTRTNCPILGLEKSNLQVLTPSTLCEKNDEDELVLTVSFPIFVIGFMSFISWILFCIFGGIGIAALPLDLIYDFCTRPKHRTFEEMMNMKDEIVKSSIRVKNMAQDAKDMENNGYDKKFFFSSDRRAYNDLMVKLRAATYLLDKDYKMYKIQTELNEEGVVWYWFGLFIGIFCILVSLTWFIHM